MALLTAVSFDEDGIKVVTGRRDRSGLAVSRTLQLSDQDALVDFLATDRSAAYLVCLNDPDIQQTTILIPPVAPNLEKGIVVSELQRLTPEFADSSCAYRVVGDQPQDGKVVRKVACTQLPGPTGAALLEPFVRTGKTVSLVATASSALSNLLPDQASSQQAILCAYDAGMRKSVFLLENGAIVFERHISSDQTGWSPVDRQNLSMTMDYCFQALRIRPERIMVMNGLDDSSEETTFPVLHYLDLPPTLAALPQARDFLIPLGALYCPLPENDNLLPAAYRHAARLAGIMTGALRITLLCAAVLISVLSYRAFSIQAQRSELKALRQQAGGMQGIYREYSETRSAYEQLAPLRDARLSIVTPPSIPHLMQLLGSLKQERMTLSSIDLKQSASTIAIKLSGTVTGKGYAENQQTFDALATRLRGVKGVVTGAGAVDQKTGAFTLEAVYTP